MNQERAVPVIPRVDLSRERSMGWLMVSNAELRSRRMRMLSEPESQESRRSLVTCHEGSPKCPTWSFWPSDKRKVVM